MATQETQLLDDVIVAGRRKMMALGGSALAGMALAGIAPKAHAGTTTYSDSDILNFALNLEYLEANFYYMAAFGTNITVSNANSQAAKALTINLTGTVGSPGNINVAPTTTGAARVPFTTAAVQAYAIETAVEEGKHVNFLLNALGSAAVAQPAINISTATFQALAAAANTLTPAGNIPSNFSPYASDGAFLVGAYIFEDVGVTAYHGAASLLTSSSNLTAAAGILAVEAYHAGLVRTSINAAASSTYVGYTTSISNLRNALSQAALLGVSGGAYDPSPDDFGLATQSVSIGALTGQTATQITDASENNTTSFAIASTRTTAQVLNIVTGGGKVSGSTLVTPAKGVFFPNGLNAGPNGFS
jgi:hypothetical protein